MDNSIKKRYWICFSLMAFILVADQALKIWIKCNFVIGGYIDMIGDWFKLYFIENEGLAFGLSLGDGIGKTILTVFRIVFSICLLVVLIRCIKKKVRYFMLVALSLIIVGALGNVIDSCFYGLIFSDSTHTDVAVLFPSEGGYTSFMHGRVVDMLYFPMFHWIWPDWIPGLGGRHAEFFSAIFNIADSAVCVGAGMLVVDIIHQDRKKKKGSNVSGNNEESVSNSSENAEETTVEAE